MDIPNIQVLWVFWSKYMKSMFSKITVVILLIISIVLLSSCVAIEDPTNSLNPNGGLISESKYLTEDVIQETITLNELDFEVELSAIQIEEIQLEIESIIESHLSENMLVEDLKIDIIIVDNINEYLNGMQSEILKYDIDWAGVVGKYAVGTAIIVVSGILSQVDKIPGIGIALKPVAFVFTGAVKGAAKGALYGMVTGAALGSINLLLENNNDIEALKKYAIEGSADGFMWGAITGAVVGAITAGMEYKVPTDSGEGFKSFYKAKQYLGSADGEWHHIVPQAAIKKSGFSPESIHNVKNLIDLPKEVHKNISGYYLKTNLPFTNGKSVANWLATKPYSYQRHFGLSVIELFTP